MSFEFVGPNERHFCKNCSDEITLEQYRRLQFCDMCQDMHDILTHGRIQRNKLTPEEIDIQVAVECGEGWDTEFLAQIRAWDLRTNV